MKTLRARWLWFALAVPIAAGALQRAAVPPAAATQATNAVTGKVVAAANAFLATLDSAERTKVGFSFNSSQKMGWSNLPSGIYQRNGLRLGDMTPAQKDAALALIAAALSRDGYKKVTDIMN